MRSNMIPILFTKSSVKRPFGVVQIEHFTFHTSINYILLDSDSVKWNAATKMAAKDIIRNLLVTSSFIIQLAP